jgi:hypothetical protein
LKTGKQEIQEFLGIQLKFEAVSPDLNLAGEDWLHLA